jgi:tetratricopeptide (TPR) repeat protein
MKISSTLLRVGALCVAVLFLLAGRSDARAQVSNVVAVPLPELTTEAEQLKAQNIRLQAQLREAELAIERNRAEAQEAARAQAAAITEKLNTIQLAIDTERKRQQDELSRQRDELQKSNSTLLYVAATFGCVGLLAMLGTAIFQWRATNRLAEVAPLRAQLAAPSAHALLPAGAGDGLPGKAVELSNQRLMSVIDRLERRVFELEHTAGKPLPAGASVTVDAEPTTPAGELDGNAARITVLLGKGQSLLDADKPEEALACYDEILKFDANYPEALVKKGAALERLKKDDEALTCYDRAIAADGTLTIAYLYKGGVYNRLERYNEALECYEQALRAQGGAA